jgi:hypothetical protein
MEKICFVIMGYGKKTDPTLGKTYDLDATYHRIIKPAVVKAGYTCIRNFGIGYNRQVYVCFTY